MKDIRIAVRDGTELACTIFLAKIDYARVVIINSATGVPRQFYRQFALVLSEAGYTVITYDYRGISESRPKKLRGYSVSIKDWVCQDMAGIVDWVKEKRRPERIFMLGHSVGGHLVGMLDNSYYIDGLITVCANSGHWRLLAKSQHLPIFFHAHITLPLLSRLFGYMPWSWCGGIDLPKGVALDWASWSRHPDYLLGDARLPSERFRHFSAPVLSCSFEDDHWGTAKAVDLMMKVYPNLQRSHLDPKTLGVPPVGHMGFFRASSRVLWDLPLAWFDTR